MPAETTHHVGGTKHFECRVKGHPRPDIRWYKDGKEITNLSRYQFDHSHDGVVSMVIPNITHGDEGHYRCRAENSEGFASTSAYLFVRSHKEHPDEASTSVHAMEIEEAVLYSSNRKEAALVSSNQKTVRQESQQLTSIEPEFQSRIEEISDSYSKEKRVFGDEIHQKSSKTSVKSTTTTTNMTSVTTKSELHQKFSQEEVEEESSKISVDMLEKCYQSSDEETDSVQLTTISERSETTSVISAKESAGDLLDDASSLLMRQTKRLFSHDFSEDGDLFHLESSSMLESPGSITRNLPLGAESTGFRISAESIPPRIEENEPDLLGMLKNTTAKSRMEVTTSHVDETSSLSTSSVTQVKTSSFRSSQVESQSTKSISINKRETELETTITDSREESKELRIFPDELAESTLVENKLRRPRKETLEQEISDQNNSTSTPQPIVPSAEAESALKNTKLYEKMEEEDEETVSESGTRSSVESVVSSGHKVQKQESKEKDETEEEARASTLSAAGESTSKEAPGQKTDKDTLSVSGDGNAQKLPLEQGLPQADQKQQQSMMKGSQVENSDLATRLSSNKLKEEVHQDEVSDNIVESHSAGDLQQTTEEDAGDKVNIPKVETQKQEVTSADEITVQDVNAADDDGFGRSDITVDVDSTDNKVDGDRTDHEIGVDNTGPDVGVDRGLLLGENVMDDVQTAERTLSWISRVEDEKDEDRAQRGVGEELVPPRRAMEDLADDRKQSKPASLPRVTSQLTDIALEAGKTLRLCTQVQGQPEVSWSRDGQTLQQGTRITMVTDEDTYILEVTQVTQADAGTYRLTAVNSAGQVFTDAVVSVVESDMSVRGASDGQLSLTATVGSPVFVTSPQDVTVSQTDTIKLTCTVKGDPTPKVSWEKDGKAIRSSRRVRVFESRGVYNLEIHDCELDDAGEYLCVAVNSQGRVTASVSVSIEGMEHVMSTTGPGEAEGVLASTPEAAMMAAGNESSSDVRRLAPSEVDRSPSRTARYLKLMGMAAVFSVAALGVKKVFENLPR